MESWCTHIALHILFLIGSAGATNKSQQCTVHMSCLVWLQYRFRQPHTCTHWNVIYATPPPIDTARRATCCDVHARPHRVDRIDRTGTTNVQRRPNRYLLRCFSATAKWDKFCPFNLHMLNARTVISNWIEWIDSASEGHVYISGLFIKRIHVLTPQIQKRRRKRKTVRNNPTQQVDRAFKTAA